MKAPSSQKNVGELGLAGERRQDLADHEVEVSVITTGVLLGRQVRREHGVDAVHRMRHLGGAQLLEVVREA